MTWRLLDAMLHRYAVWLAYLWGVITGALLASGVSLAMAWWF